ncbi:hypothetical protein [Saccharomonospora piscinae]|uniref:hypothetical protein n=1 Tax=Saccharomonospora piscinae TaxID=687388 RepID=UPI00111BEAD9|nr:hypothetical protein [Saccharomonospora piscinae]
MTHWSYGSHKIGICNVANRARRLGSLKKSGWETFKTVRVANGDIARQVEQGVINKVRMRGFPHYLTADLMLYGGYTETIDAEATTLPELWAMVNSELVRVISSRQ